MAPSINHLSRRQFLKLAGSGLAASFLSNAWLGVGRAASTQVEWPKVRLQDLPSRLGDLLDRVPHTAMSSGGYLKLLAKAPTRQAETVLPGTVQHDPPDLDAVVGDIPLSRTRWNLENCAHYHRLQTGHPWGIVLHWFGDRDGFPGTVEAYMRGFDDLRRIDEYAIRTSAHFLVGRQVPTSGPPAPYDLVGILQTQAPDKDGTPFVAAHLSMIDYQEHREKRQYFVRALYQLGYADPGVHSLLQDFYDGPRVDPNLRTIGIECCGYDFENPGHPPPDQQIANVVSLVWALMQRYEIPAMNILGHQELQLSKPDPGKKFLALIRYLIGAKALVEGDEHMKRLVFGSFLEGDQDGSLAVARYFRFVHDYLVMTGSQRRVYEWEAASKFWFLYDRLLGRDPGLDLATRFEMPLQLEDATLGKLFLVPQNHEGTDLYPYLAGSTTPASADVNLFARGTCLYLGETAGCRWGKAAMFQHRQPDGAEIVSVYGHLTGLEDLAVGRSYPAGYRLGNLRPDAGHRESFLHFAVAYAATWRTDLSLHPTIPLNAGFTWIRERYLSPLTYLDDRLASRPFDQAEN